MLRARSRNAAPSSVSDTARVERWNRVTPSRRSSAADYRSNRQYLSTANVATDDRVSLFLMDYPARRRLKLIGHAHTSNDPSDIAALLAPGTHAKPERAFVIDIVGFDWNCPQHISPLFSEAQLTLATQPLLDELAQLRAGMSGLEGMQS